MFFLDASVLVKRYSQENGSRHVNELFRRVPAREMTCLTMGILEVVSILVRKNNDGRLSDELYTQVMIDLKAELIDADAFCPLVVTDAQVLSALSLIRKHNLNATDAIILRAVLDVSQRLEDEDRLMLWTSDRRLVRAAEAEGVSAFDPEIESRERLVGLL